VGEDRLSTLSNNTTLYIWTEAVGSCVVWLDGVIEAVGTCFVWLDGVIEAVGTCTSLLFKAV